jgi:hypothetical protein
MTQESFDQIVHIPQECQRKQYSIIGRGICDVVVKILSSLEGRSRTKIQICVEVPRTLSSIPRHVSVVVRSVQRGGVAG